MGRVDYERGILIMGLKCCECIEQGFSVCESCRCLACDFIDCEKCESMINWANNIIKSEV